MSPEDSKVVAEFETRVRQLMLAYNTLKQENEELYAMVDEKETTIKQIQAEKEKLRAQYADLKTAKMIEIGDNDMKDAKQRFSRLVREVDKCIALLNI